jgi:hypothetical protein
MPCSTAALGGELRLPAFDVGDVDRVRLGDEAVDRRRGVEILHRHLEARDPWTPCRRVLLGGESDRRPGGNAEVKSHRAGAKKGPSRRSFLKAGGALEYPTAAASAVVLTILVTLIVTAILRTVDVRKEITR